jgi:aspartyl-tRNA(Asn)/glutamyl-tRNA(Gln) amidotransferase subunit C
MATRITADEVRRIASLSRLELSDAEVVAMTHDMESILAYVESLEEVDVEGVVPMDHVHDAALILRPDEPRPSLPQEVALHEAPSAGTEGFAVPAFVDEG